MNDALPQGDEVHRGQRLICWIAAIVAFAGLLFVNLVADVHSNVNRTMFVHGWPATYLIRTQLYGAGLRTLNGTPINPRPTQLERLPFDSTPILEFNFAQAILNLLIAMSAGYIAYFLARRLIQAAGGVRVPLWSLFGAMAVVALQLGLFSDLETLSFSILCGVILLVMVTLVFLVKDITGVPWIGSTKEPAPAPETPVSPHGQLVACWTAAALTFAGMAFVNSVPNDPNYHRYFGESRGWPLSYLRRSATLPLRAVPTPPSTIEVSAVLIDLTFALIVSFFAFRAMGKVARANGGVRFRLSTMIFMMPLAAAGFWLLRAIDLNVRIISNYVLVFVGLAVFVCFCPPPSRACEKKEAEA